MTVLTSKVFWIDTTERAVKTAAQTALALLTVDGANLFTLTTEGFWSAVGLASLISVLTSVISSGRTDTASLVINAPEARK
jgi:hypothetical protein